MDEKRIDAVETVGASQSPRRNPRGTVRVGEIESLRTEHRKVFQMDDGSQQAVFCSARETQEDAPWELDTDSKKYRKCHGSLHTAFSCDGANEELFSLEKDAHKVTFCAAVNGKRRRNGIVPTVRNTDGMDRIFRFENVADHTDMEYFASSDGVKENILVKQKADNYRYPFVIHCENVSISPDSTEKQINFISTVTGEEVFFIPSPFMVDAIGEVSGDVHYELEAMDDGTTMLTMVADSDWMNAPYRAFPVTIDPQTLVSGSSDITCYSWTDGTMTAPSEFPVGRVAVTNSGTGAVTCSTKRMYLHFNMPKFPSPKLPKNPRIKKAELVFYQNSVSNETDPVPKLGLFRIAGDISQGMVTPSQDPQLIDYASMKSASEDGTTVSYSFDITKIFDEAANGASSYQNLVLRLLDETISSTCCATLAGNGTAATRPYILVDYEPSFGVNSSYPAHTHSIGPFCQGSVDLATGNLMFQVEDFNWAGNRMPITLNHLYNSTLADKAFTHDADTLISGNFNSMKIGNGWKLNMMQSMKNYNFVHDGVRKSGYVYMDDNSNAVYFVKQADSELYETIDDSGMTYAPATLTMVNGDASYLFDSAGRLIRITEKCIADETNGNTNVTSLTYTNNQLTQVTDSIGRVFTFTYDSSSHLTAITAPDDTQVLYSYTGDLLTSITYPNGTKTVFTYINSKPASVSVLDANNAVLYKVCYSFTGDRVTSVAEFGQGGNVEGKCSAYNYSAAAKRTEVVSTEQAEEDGAADQIITTVYTFDEDGQILSQYAYAQDMDKIGVSGVGSGIHPYFGEDGIPTVSMSTNLLTNHGFESLTGWDTVGNGQYNCVYNPLHSKVGNRFLRLASADSTKGTIGVSQTCANLPAGTYTFSAHLRPLSTETNSDEQGAYLQVTDRNGIVLAESEHLQGYDTDYVRMAVSFDLTAAMDVNVKILMDGEGRIMVDAAQLEACSYATAYNLLENGHFDASGADWQCTEGAQYDADTCFHSGRSVQITGDPDSARNAQKEVSVKRTRSDRETFTLSGWAKGTALPARERDGCPDSQFRLRAVIHYEDSAYDDNSTETFTADFSPCTEDWQYASVQFCKSKYRIVSKLEVFCDFDHNSGTVYFDDIQLVRDSLETQLAAEDFAFADDEVNTDNETQTGTEDEAENPYVSPTFEEVLDQFGNALTETTFTDGEFGTVYRSFGFDENGNNLIRETDARGYVTTYTVDPDTSRNQSVTDRYGNQTTYEYDASGKTTKVTAKNASGATVATVGYSYDAFGELSAITRGDGMVYDLAYDAFHNLASIGVRDKDEKLVNYTYKNGNGRLKEISYANGDTMKATYNSLGQMVTEKWFDGTGALKAYYKYSYDDQGNIIRSVDMNSQKEYNYTYEEGRVTRAVESELTLNDSQMVTSKTIVHTLRYIYDQEGNLVRKHSVAADGTEQVSYCETDGNDNTLVKVQMDGHTYTSHSKNDSFGRKEFDEIQTGTGCISRQFLYHVGQKTEEHLDSGKVKSTPTTNLVKQIILYDGHTISYEYDQEERITKVIDSIDGTTEYTYDAQGQLLTETVNLMPVNTMAYDAYGNITKKNGKVYGYDTTWKDLLISYDGQSIIYDAQGNPTTYLGHTLAWEKGRQLKSFDGNTYTYNANGIRTSKTVGGVEHTYTLEGTKILRETWDGNTLIPLYDNEETVCGIIYNGTPFYFQKNLQGDVIAICTRAGAVVALYSYDAWGACSITFSDPSTGIANINPFRYRGYYYDSEIGMYYLQSRYYNPALGRFVNGDTPMMVSFIATPTLHNLFAYCQNDAINYSDALGYLSWPGEIHNYVQNILAAYIWMCLKCFTYVNYFIRFSAYKYGFADLYAKNWNEIWEVKPNKKKYRTSGPKQLKKYLDGIKGSKAGRNLGVFTTYYYSSGFYKVDIYSYSNDGMIYYDYKYCWKVNATILAAVASIALIASGAGASIGAPALAGILALV